MHQETFQAYPTFEGQKFNPKKEVATRENLAELQQMLIYFKDAFHECLYRDIEKQVEDTAESEKIAARTGSIAAKIFLRCIDLVPLRQQETLLTYLRQTEQNAENDFNYNDWHYLSGFYGELATGHLLIDNGLEPVYPSTQEDDLQSADFKVTLPDGRPANVQSKILSLPRNLRREVIQNPLPIFSPLETFQDWDIFQAHIRSIKTGDTRIGFNLLEIEKDARNMRQQAQSFGFVPIFCLLHKPGDPELESADIDLRTGQANPAAASQAKAEMDALLRRYGNRMLDTRRSI